jgi:hypothetical protein
MAKEILTIENGIKYAMLLFTMAGFYYKQSSDIRDLNTQKHYEIEHVQYQLNELKDCCNGKRNEKRIVFNDQKAILPNGIEIENER